MDGLGRGPAPAAGRGQLTPFLCPGVLKYYGQVVPSLGRCDAFDGSSCSVDGLEGGLAPVVVRDTLIPSLHSELFIH